LGRFSWSQNNAAMRGFGTELIEHGEDFDVRCLRAKRLVYLQSAADSRR
jgi:hypothetical protein